MDRAGCSSRTSGAAGRRGGCTCSIHSGTVVPGWRAPHPGRRESQVLAGAGGKNKGSLFPQYALGRLFFSDDPDVHDSEEGIRWLKAAAQNGNNHAAYALGKEYLRGQEVPKDAVVAASCLRQAAEVDNPWAQYLLGETCICRGDGVEKDDDAAYRWFRSAASRGHTYAQFFCGPNGAAGICVIWSTALCHPPPAPHGPHLPGQAFHLCRCPTVCRLTGNGSRSCGKRKLPWDINRMTTKRSRAPAV